MASRGLWHFMGARTRRSLALSWSALFVLSLLLQYFSFALAPAALAVHDEGLFELDGDTIANNAAAPIGPADDWDSHPGATGNRFIFKTDPLSQQTDDIFTGGSTKDDLNTSGWHWTTGSVPDKDNIENAFAASYVQNGHTFVYFGLDRFANNGDAFTGFWFFKSGVGPVPGGNFSGPHSVGDLLVLSNFTNGGSTATIELYEWVGSGGDTNGTLNKLATGNVCTGSPATDKACAVTNSSPINPSWTFDDKFTNGTNNPIPEDSFFEGGIDLDALFAPSKAPCFGSYLAETRASQSVDAVLKDFTGGAFNTCVPPTIETTSSTATADFGANVHDTATLSGNDGPASGTVKFFVCGPTATKPDCSTGGTAVGGAIPVVTTQDGGHADSPNFQVGVTAAASGWYCWRAEYTPDANSQYLAGKHTDTNTECFFVAPATIEISKTATPVGPVNAGDPIGFLVTVHNNGTQTTFNANVNDPLPGGVDWTLGTVTGGASCQINGPVGTEVLTCTKASLAADASYSVAVSAQTDKTDCGTINNSANVTTTNDGTDSDSASVVVQCPDVKVTKTPDGGTVDAGDPITWAIKVENIGAGTATGVTLTDNLPAGIHWTESEADCDITGLDDSQVLSCNVGTLANGASKTYHVTGTTDKADCHLINNTATASATNEPSNVLANNSDSGSVTVQCATVTIGKTANPAGPVSAGSAIGFDLTWGNSGAGKATGVTVTDTLPTVPGVSWSINGFTGTGSTCVINGSNPQVLTCTGFDIPGNTAVSGTVHLTSATTAQSCQVIPNAAHIGTGNDGSADANASVTVQCPDLQVVKTGNGPLFPGDPATFTIVLTNLGPGAAANVTLDDQLPAGTWTKGGANAGDCTIVNNLLHCNFGTVASGATRTVTVTKTATTAECPTIHNDVTVGASNEPAGALGNNTDDADIAVTCADVHVLKTADEGTISAGEDAAFTIVVSNAGPGTAKNVTLHDTLPAGIDWAINPGVTGCAIVSGVLDCSFASLANGASVTIHISGTTSNEDCAGLDNTAVVAALNEKVADQSDNSSSASINVDCPDIGVTKVADVGTISAGDTAAFTVVVTNHGPGTAFDVHVADTLPAGVTWVLDPTVTGCNIVGTALTCDFTSLASGDTRTLHIKGETDAQDCHVLHNAVVVSASNEVPDDQFPNEASADITVLCPTIVITKTANPAGPVSAGDPIGFDIVVTNTGDGNAFNVTVADTLPTTPGTSWTIDAANSSPGWSISAGVLHFGPATLAGHSEVHVRIVSGTTAASCTLIPNTASVTFNGGTGSDDSVVEVDCPDVNVIKTPDQGTVNAGSNAVFTIVVSNSDAEGIGTAHDVTLTDNLPAGYVWTLGGIDKADCHIDTAPNPDVLSCNFGDLAPGESRSITLTAPTTGSNCDVIPNTATVDATNEPNTEQYTDDDSDSASIDVLCADIAIEKVANPEGPVNAGDTIGFDITVSNNGDGTATGVEMTDVLPAGIDWTAGDPTGDTSGVECSIEGGTLTCTDPSMASGDSFTVHISGATDAADCGIVDNTANVTTTNDGSDEASASVDVLCPDVKVVKDAVNTPIPVGQDLVYSITTSNIGLGVARDVTLTDTLPAGFDWSVDNEDCDIAAGVLTCDFGDMAPGDSIKVTLTAPTSADPETGNIDCTDGLVHQIPNVASATSSNEGQDVLGNNSDDASITVLCSALAIDKSFTGNTNGTDPDLGVPSAKIGDTLHYTLHYSGAGPIADAVITDVLPEGLDYVVGSAAGDANFTFDSYDSATRTLKWVAAEGLPDPADGTVTYDVKVLDTAPDFAQPLVNLATIVGHTPTGAELTDSDTAAVAVLAPPEELTPPPTSTLTPQTGTSNPGFALMLILIGVAGLTLGIGFITPVPARVRRRDRLG